MSPRPETRHDLEEWVIGEHLRLEAFWKDLPIGRGPAASVWACGHEVLRFDCFGPGQGHYHVASCHPGRVREHRLYFPEPTCEAQIERSIFELTRNLDYYLQRIPHRQIRFLEVDPDRLERAAEWLRSRMMAHLVTSRKVSDEVAPSAHP